MAVLDLPASVTSDLARLERADAVVAVLAYNNADTLGDVLAAAAEGAARHLPGARTAALVVDAGSSDGTRELVASAALPAVVVPYEAPAGERVAVPFHGVPGRGVALRTALLAARTLGIRALVLLEADVVTATPDWMAA
ncbi:MAG TPA: glycosyltransferase, partial [Candidatus Tectomicrobia bacterium]|nr:glycosyltransferase [Candidatus Tectomicrobia bacterium]